MATGSPAAAGVTVGVGVVMDMDHLYDYYQWLIKSKPRRVYVLLHAWEYSFLGLAAIAVFWSTPLLIAVVLGHLAHVTSDHLYNRMPRFSYFITYRIAKGFRISRPPHRHGDSGDQSLGLSRLLPLGLGRIFAPWLDRKLGPWIKEREKEGMLEEDYHRHHA